MVILIKYPHVLLSVHTFEVYLLLIMLHKVRDY